MFFRLYFIKLSILKYFYAVFFAYYKLAIACVKMHIVLGKHYQGYSFFILSLCNIVKENILLERLERFAYYLMAQYWQYIE